GIRMLEVTSRSSNITSAPPALSREAAVRTGPQRDVALLPREELRQVNFRMKTTSATTESRVPKFLVRPEPRFAGWGSALALFWTPNPVDRGGSVARFSGSLVET